MEDASRLAPGGIPCGDPWRLPGLAWRSLSPHFGRSRQWQEHDLLRAFREILLMRAEAYLRTGRVGEPVPVFVRQQWPEVASALEALPPQVPARAMTFLYWEKIHLGGKPIDTITHVTVLRDTGAAGCDLIAVSRHVFSTRHISDGWSVLALVPPYFSYFYQARIDRLGGLLGGLVRHFVEREIKARAGDTLLGLRNRLDTGDPPLWERPSDAELRGEDNSR